jgi:CRP-like cAMP-binding protein
MIDRLREQIQQRLDQLVGEADRLRKALAALDPRSPSAPAAEAASPTARSRRRAPATAGPKAPAPKSAPSRRTTQPAARTPRRTAPGATKAAVLTALAGGTEMTAGQVADKSGLPRATVSTTLSRLAKSGEIQKAPRGYRLAPTTEPSATS